MAFQLGKYLIMPPLSVRVTQRGGQWLSELLPEDLTDFEFGTGPSAEEALEDLEDSIHSMKEFLSQLPYDLMASALQTYKDSLDNYVVINTTVQVK